MGLQENWQDFEDNGDWTFFETLNKEKYDDFKHREKALDDMIAAKEEQKKRKQQREARERALSFHRVLEGIAAGIAKFHCWFQQHKDL
jgi:hypothetical protein